MTQSDWELAQEIDRAVHNLVDEMTQGLSEESDDEIRQMLTEQFRFWRRKYPT